MKITKFQIKNFKSILDSGEIALDPKITTLIGKNESGKTCILKALESFKRSYKYTKDDLCLHSKAREKLELKKIEEENIEIVTIWFEIEADDKQKLKEINSQFIKIKILKITKYFNNLYKCENPEISSKDTEINVKKKLEKNLSEIKRAAITFKEKLDNHSQRYAPFNNSKAQYEEIINEMISFDPEANPEIDKVFSGYSNTLISLPNMDAPIQNDTQAFIGEINPYKDGIKKILLEKEKTVINDILEILPNFMYFADVEKLEDIVPISEFLTKRKEHKTLSNLIDLLNLDIERVKDAMPYDMLSEFRVASTAITGMINQSWTQEKVIVNVDIVKNEIVISIVDDVSLKDHPPSIRSQGFQWFLSFYINFKAGSGGEFKNTIILLDDLGIYLHPSGQRDLLNTLEKIAESNQFVFSTHSPFMIDREKLYRVRIVSKKEPKGTTIEEKFYVSDYDALELIRASIGMKIGDSLFISKRNLLVEGYSDELILEAMSTVSSNKNRDFCDTSKVSIFPVNGANKMPFFAIICKKENLKFLVLLDYDPEGRKVSGELKEQFNINKDNIIMLNKLGGPSNDLETENLIDIDFYLKAVNIAYEEIFHKKLGKKNIEKQELKEATFKGIKKFFREKNIGTSRRIDKIKVAKKINDLVAEGKTPNDKTIASFSRLFKIVNERLKVS